MIEQITKQNFNNILTRFSTAELEDLLVKFPYFHQAHLLLAKKYQQEGNPRFDGQLQLAAFYSQDKELLFSVLHEKELFHDTETPPTVEEVVVERADEMLTKEDIQSPVMEEDSRDVETADIDEVLTSSSENEPITEIHKDKVKPQFDVSLAHTFDEWLVAYNKQEVNDESLTTVQVLQQDMTEPDEELEKLIESNVSSDYLHELVEEETNYSKGLDKFIEEQIQKHKHDERPATQYDNQIAPELITETMAKVYEMQKKYSKAIRAYEILTLKYPEKNDFFAARINYLKNII